LRCFFDTNVLVSALLLPTSKPRQALDLALRRGTILTILLSAENFVEFGEPFSKPLYLLWKSAPLRRTLLSMKLALIGGFLAVVLLPTIGSVQNTHPTLPEPLVVVQNGKYGYIEHDGTVLVQPQFFWASDFENGFGRIYVCGRVVSIDVSGKLLPPQTAQGKNELRPKRVGRKFGFVDASGRLTVDASFDDVLPFSDGMAAVRIRDKWGFIDTTGRTVIPPTFEAAFYFREGVATATKDDDTVLIDKSGKVLARGFEQLHGVIAQGLVPVSRNDKYGYLDLHGAIAIPLMYDDVDAFSQGLASVKKGTKWGYIDKNGVTAIPFAFDSAGVFGSGLAPVRMGDQSGFIDMSGNFVFRLAFQYAPGFWSLEGDTDVSRFWTKDGAFGYVDTSGRVIWGPTTESPDHAPLLGWSEKDKVNSCADVPQAVRKLVGSFPERDE
jgi:hypothetical protein